MMEETKYVYRIKFEVGYENTTMTRRWSSVIVTARWLRKSHRRRPIPGA